MTARGFTLIELLVTLSVLGLILALALRGNNAATAAQREQGTVRALGLLISSASRTAEARRTAVRVEASEGVVQLSGAPDLDTPAVPLPSSLQGPSGVLLRFASDGTTAPTTLSWQGKYDRYTLSVTAIGEVSRE